jgi:hypothetical protein
MARTWPQTSLRPAETLSRPFVRCGSFGEPERPSRPRARSEGARGAAGSFHRYRHVSADQEQTILPISNGTVVSPLAFTVSCACVMRNARDPSDPWAMALIRSVSLSTSTSPCLTTLTLFESEGSRDF